MGINFEQNISDSKISIQYLFHQVGSWLSRHWSVRPWVCNSSFLGERSPVKSPTSSLSYLGKLRSQHEFCCSEVAQIQTFWRLRGALASGKIRSRSFHRGSQGHTSSPAQALASYSWAHGPHLCTCFIMQNTWKYGVTLRDRNVTHGQIVSKRFEKVFENCDYINNSTRLPLLLFCGTRLLEIFHLPDNQDVGEVFTHSSEETKSTKSYSYVNVRSANQLDLWLITEHFIKPLGLILEPFKTLPAISFRPQQPNETHVPKLVQHQGPYDMQPSSCTSTCLDWTRIHSIRHQLKRMCWRPPKDTLEKILHKPYIHYTFTSYTL